MAIRCEQTNHSNPFARPCMLEIAAIIFLVLTIPIWLPMTIGIFTSLLRFGFMAVFWLVLIAAAFYLIFV